MKPNALGKYEGHIYRCWVIAPGEDYGKSYIIHTTSPKDKLRLWKQPGSAVGGKKIMEAREKYDPVKDWQVDHIETVTKDTEGELMAELKKRHTYYIDLYDSINNGYNTCHGGTGNKDVAFSQEWRDKISENHRDYQTPGTRRKISISNTGREVKESTRKLISIKNKGRKRTEEQRKAQSERSKGRDMSKVNAGAAAWRAANPPYWSNHDVSEETKAKQKQFQREKNARAIKVTEKDGTVNVFETRTDAAKYYSVKPGCITSYIKTGKPTKNWGNVFENITKEEYYALKAKSSPMHTALPTPPATPTP